MANSMILNELKLIVEKGNQKALPQAYIKNSLKEYLQAYVLNFIYTTDKYKKSLIFTGGTCLKHCYGLNRLSEDIDFDKASKVNIYDLKKDILNYFKKTYLYEDANVSVKQKGRQLLLKFPVLRKLNLASKQESDLLYVKLDISVNQSKFFKTKTTFKNIYDFNYMMFHYDLPTLMAGKISAIFQRQRFIGKDNREVIKGRDYFDLLWFLDKKIIPNIDRINDTLKLKLNLKKLVKDLDKKVELATAKFKLDFKRDIFPFISNQPIIDDYVKTYKQNYNNKKKYLLN